MNATAATTGYNQQNNIWNTGTYYSTSSIQNNITNIYNGCSSASTNANTSIFADSDSSGVVTSVPMSDVMLAPFGATQTSYSSSYGTTTQTQETDYTGKVLDMMMTMCMMLFEKKFCGNDDSETETVVDNTGDDDDEVEIEIDDDDEVEIEIEVEDDDVIYYTGSGISEQVSDPEGDTTTQIGGFDNSITFTGDSGANTFYVNGTNNNITVQDIGKSGDDTVVLEGDSKDWEIIDAGRDNGRAFKKDSKGYVTYRNCETGTIVTVVTEEGGRFSSDTTELWASKNTVFSDGSDTEDLYNDYVDSKRY